MTDNVEAARHIIERMERLPASLWQVKARVIVGTATFFDGFDGMAIAIAMPAIIAVWHLAPHEVGILLGSGSFGQAIGAIFFGWLAERWGRLNVAILTIALFSISSLLCVFAWDFNSLLVLRVIQGIGLGGEVPVAATYISEIAKARNRGMFVMLYETIFGVGIFVASLIGVWLVPNFGWQSIFVVGALPAFLAIAMRRSLPESPRWLASRGRIAEADRIVGKIEQTIEGYGHTLPPPQPLTVAPRVENGRLAELFSRFYLSRTIVAWSICFCAGFLSHGVTQWLPSILTTVFHLPLRDSLAYGVLSTTMAIAGGLGCAFVIDWMGRRNWFVLSFVVCAACFLILGWVGQPTLGLVIVLTTIGRFFSSSAVTLIYLYIPELYPTRLRATGNGTAGLWLRLGNGAAPMVVGYLLAAEGIGIAFTILGGLAVIGALGVAKFAFETNRRVLEEISP